MSKKRLLILISSLNFGGAQRIAAQISELLSNEWEITFLLNGKENIAFPVKAEIIDLGIVPPKDKENIMYQLKVFLRRYSQVKKLKKSGDFTACLSFMDSAHVINILTDRKNTKTVLQIVNTMSVAKRNKLKIRLIVSPLIKLLYNKASLIIAQSDAMKDDLVKNFNIKASLVTTINSAIDFNELKQNLSSPLPEEDHKWFSKDLTVVTAGRMEYQKGHWHLIRSFSEVIKEVPDARLVIFGSGTLRDSLSELILKMGLEKNILLHSPSPYLEAYYASSAVFAFPSIFEGFGIAMQEALACGIPCVSSDYQSGARELLGYDKNDEKITEVTLCPYGIITPAFYYDEQTRLSDLTDANITKEEKIFAKALLMVLTDSELKENLRQKSLMRGQNFDSEKIRLLWEKALS